MTLGNTPKRLTNISLEKNKSFALNIRFSNDDGTPFDTTDVEIRLSADQPKYWGAAQVLTLVADHLDDPAGLVQFKFQATDTALEDGEYPYDVTMLSVRGYSTPLLKGTIVIGANTDEINDNVFTEVHPSDELVVLFGTSCDVEIILSQVDGLLGPQGETGDKGDPTAVFIQPEEPAPDAIPPYFPLWVDTDAEYHHSGYVYEAPEPDPDMPTGVLYFDNDETVIPPDGVGVLYVKDQNGDLIPVTRGGPEGPEGPEGPPGVAVIVSPIEPSANGLPEGAMWVDEDSVVPAGDGGGSGGGGGSASIMEGTWTWAESLGDPMVYEGDGKFWYVDEKKYAVSLKDVDGNYHGVSLANLKPGDVIYTESSNMSTASGTRTFLTDYPGWLTDGLGTDVALLITTNQNLITTLVGEPFKLAWDFTRAAVLSGTATPTAGTGAVGDYYLDTDDHILYGPKKAGAAPDEYVAQAGTMGTGTVGSGQMTAMKFRFNASGYVKGIRLKTLATGALSGWEVYLWTKTGTLLASSDAPALTSNSWNQVNFVSPIEVVAGVTYMAGFWTPNTGVYPVSATSYTGDTSGNVVALAEGVDGAALTYATVRDTFPTNTGAGAMQTCVSPVFSTAVSAWPVALRSVPPGGTTGQILKKTGSADYAIGWVT